MPTYISKSAMSFLSSLKLELVRGYDLANARLSPARSSTSSSSEQVVSHLAQSLWRERSCISWTERRRFPLWRGFDFGSFSSSSRSSSKSSLSDPVHVFVLFFMIELLMVGLLARRSSSSSSSSLSVTSSSMSSSVSFRSPIFCRAFSSSAPKWRRRRIAMSSLMASKLSLAPPRTFLLSSSKSLSTLTAGLGPRVTLPCPRMLPLLFLTLSSLFFTPVSSLLT
mmetsp:Transcript_6842/g.12316  ORF Transcript_6842/g.12316 Transcript_6842/m.12316 type:complete len:224 (-) Transcript_6842:199-870(-)